MRPLFSRSRRPLAAAAAALVVVASLAAPTAGAGFRYQDRPQSGHVTPPLGRGSPSRVPSAGQKRKGSVGEKETSSVFSALTRGP